jgi:hypothetical protein
MKFGRRQWVITISLVGALIVGVGAGFGVWLFTQTAGATAEFSAAVTGAREANGERNRAALELNETRAEALARHTAALALVAATEPSVLDDAATREGLSESAASLANTAGLQTADGESARLPDPLLVTRAPRLAGTSFEMPGNRDTKREATTELQRETAALVDESHRLHALTSDIDDALSALTAAEDTLMASAYAKGQTTELPELAADDTKDAYAAAVTALSSYEEGADLVALITTYTRALAAAITSAEEAVRAQDPASVEPSYIRGILVVNKTYGLPSWFGDGLTAETTAAFDRMRADAASAGHELYISSGFRSYGSQESIYNRYVAADGQAEADRYSARPGHSEHQSGLTFDLNCICEAFGHQADGQWVADNAHRYGFIVRYPQAKEQVTGYIWEPWHLRYLGIDVATDVFQSGLTLEEYLGVTSKYSN